MKFIDEFDCTKYSAFGYLNDELVINTVNIN